MLSSVTAGSYSLLDSSGLESLPALLPDFLSDFVVSFSPSISRVVLSSTTFFCWLFSSESINRMLPAWRI